MVDTRHVTARWDPESEVWWAESEDIPGFITEAPTFDGLIARASELIEDLLTADGHGSEHVVVKYIAESQVELELAGSRRG